MLVRKPGLSGAPPLLKEFRDTDLSLARVQTYRA